MKILLLNQFFWPDSAATSQFLTDLARELSARGHQVDVLCGGGRAYAQQDESGRPAVTIRRSLSLPFGRSKPMRLLSYASFLTTAGLLGLFRSKPDLVITLTTPPLVGMLGTFIKYARGVRHISWEMDLYPDVICDLGYFSAENPLIRLIGAVADFSRHHADGIIALGECMKRRLVARGVAPEKIHVSENWADGEVIEPLPFPALEPVTVLYSGNLGLGHDVETIADAMFALKDDPRFRFVFAGGGGRRDALETFCSQNAIPSVSFRPYCRREDLGQSLGEGHIGLVTQNAKCSGSIVPSKAYGILAAGRPLLYIGPADSTPAHLVHRFGCGWQIDCGDSEGLQQLLVRLAQNPDEIFEAGRASRAAFVSHYDRATGLEHLCSLLFDEQPVTAPLHAASASLSITGPITDSKL